MKMCLKSVCKCMVRASHLKMLQVNRRALFRYPWTQHLVCIILFTFRRSFTEYVVVHILNLTGYSTQMCYSVNIPLILGAVVLTETDTNHHLRGTSARHHDLIPAQKLDLNMSKINRDLLRNLQNVCAYVWVCVCVPADLCADICAVGWQQCILAVGGRIEANKLLMLARSESEQIQQIRWKIHHSLSETDRHCIIFPCRSIWASNSPGLQHQSSNDNTVAWVQAAQAFTPNY